MFGLWGYAWAFYVFSVVIAIILVVQLTMIPNKINFDRISRERADQDEPSDFHDRKAVARAEVIQSIPQAQSSLGDSYVDTLLAGYNLLPLNQVGMRTILKAKDACFAFLACSVGMYNVSFFTVFLALHLQKEFLVQADDMGYYFALLSFPYFFSALLVPALFGGMPRKLQFILCFFLTALGFMLMGPSSVLGLPNVKYLIMLGLPLTGFVQALVFIPSLPEAIEVIQQKYKIVEKSNIELDNKLNDVMGSMFALAYNLSGLIAPIIGGLMYDSLSQDENISYRKTMDINMFFELLAAFIFIIFNCGRVFHDNAAQKADLAKMQEITKKLVAHDKSQVMKSTLSTERE